MRVAYGRAEQRMDRGGDAIAYRSTRLYATSVCNDVRLAATVRG